MSRIPVVRLGEPNENEKQANYDCMVIEDITVWYDKKLQPENPDEPIKIDARKVLFSHDLKIENAKQYVKSF